ncbi:hypothetical protein J4434_04250 [Candidatus Woesearchaeota archaeon]|nr:hypothetical protein [Candidatus Woesearchaeota archaeon]
MTMEPELKKKVKEYIDKEYHKGFTFTSIEKVLLDRGYNKEDIDEIINELVKEPSIQKLKKGIPFLIISLLLIFGVIAFIFFFRPFGYETCDTKECFINLANECKPSVYILDDAGTKYEFKSFLDCTFTKTITEISDSEPEPIKEMFAKRSFTCTYEKNNFEVKWIDTLLGGLDKCTGPLKEALYELTIAQYKKEKSII